MSSALIHDKTRKLLQQLSTEQLLDLLRQDALENTLSDAGICVEMIMEVLEERAKESDRNNISDVSQVWQDFQTKYNALEGKGLSLFDVGEEDGYPETRVSRRASLKIYRVRRTIVIAAIIAVLLAIMIPAAFGYNIFEVFAHWTDDWFQLDTSDPANDDSTEESVVTPLTEEQFGSLQEAFDAFQIHGIQEPQWLPENYILTDVLSYYGETCKNISASYISGDDCLLILADMDSTPSNYYQKDTDAVNEFYVNGIKHYIFSNNANMVAVWYYENVEFMVTGPVDKQSLQDIVASMYP